MRKVLAVAALVLGVSFGVAACGGSNPAPSPSPTPPGGSVYPASAQNTILNDCEQAYGQPPTSYCQCNLGWLETNIPYSMFEQDPATFEQQADGYASC
jgi:hypothetical protein